MRVSPHMHAHIMASTYLHFHSISAAVSHTHGADGDSADGDRCLHVSVCLCCIWEGQECLLIPLCGCHVQDRLSDEALDCVEMVSKGDIHSAQC